CFFGGRNWHLAGRYWNQTTVPQAGSKIQILAGRSMIVNSTFRLNQVGADDPAIATVAPLAQKSFSVAAHPGATTQIQTRGPAAGETRVWEIEVKSPYPARR